MKTPKSLPILYRELANWWPLLSHPEHYKEEARYYQRALEAACTFTPRTLLELGSGGGNNASHLKAHYQMTLVDLSVEMLGVSQKLNPECEHIHGDMRTVRLGRLFDTIFIHDAIGYMLSEEDLLKALVTAYVHCRPGGAALFVPDHTRETFKPSTLHGGSDNEERALRYLEWTWDPDAADNTYIAYMVYVLREADDNTRCLPDRHLLGLFSHSVWLRLIEQAGFVAQSLTTERSEEEPGAAPVFIGLKAAEE